jgi:choline-sulfatase
MEDPDEQTNVFGYPGHAGRIKSMQQDLARWYSRHVDPRLDGTRLPVTGRGQRAHASEEDAFAYRFFE